MFLSGGSVRGLHGVGAVHEHVLWERQGGNAGVLRKRRGGNAGILREQLGGHGRREWQCWRHPGTARRQCRHPPGTARWKCQHPPGTVDVEVGEQLVFKLVREALFVELDRERLTVARVWEGKG